MAFWGSERLTEHFNELISNAAGVSVETGHCNLRMGKEVFISASTSSNDSTNQYVKRLEENEWFAIPAGHFAALLTEESVTVPVDALALISMKATIKFRGLVNISGFHVDPGYSGCLTFSVYNAGPAPVYLRRGQPCFMIWYADLEQRSRSRDNQEAQRERNARSPGHEDHLNQQAIVAGRVPTYESLEMRLRSVEDQQRIYIAAAGFFVSVALGMISYLFTHHT